MVQNVFENMGLKSNFGADLIYHTPAKGLWLYHKSLLTAQDRAHFWEAILSREVGCLGFKYISPIIELGFFQLCAEMEIGYCLL